MGINSCSFASLSRFKGRKNKVEQRLISHLLHDEQAFKLPVLASTDNFEAVGIYLVYTDQASKKSLILELINCLPVAHNSPQKKLGPWFLGNQLKGSKKKIFVDECAWRHLLFPIILYIGLKRTRKLFPLLRQSCISTYTFLKEDFRKEKNYFCSRT